MKIMNMVNALNDAFDIELKDDDNLLITDWKSLIPVMLDSTLSVSERALLFHNSLAHVILQQAELIKSKSQIKNEATNVASFFYLR